MSNLKPEENDNCDTTIETAKLSNESEWKDTGKIKERKRRKYSKINLNYFEDIDTDEKAYFLGLLASDGNISKYSIRISLQEKDGYILEKYSNRIVGENCIKLYKTNHGTTTSNFRVTSRKMVSDISKWGILPNKTFYLDIPIETFSETLFKSFLLGLTDGDGSIYYSTTHKKYTYLTYKLCCVDPLCSKIINRLQSYFSDIKIQNNVIQCNNNKQIKEIRIGKQKSVIDFLSWIYDTKLDIFLQRKKEKYTNFIRNLP